MKVRLSSILALLLTAVSGAWADSFSADAYAANATLNGVSVTANQTVTINKDVTVTVNNGLTISTGVTLTVTGGGTLVVNGATGANGNDWYMDTYSEAPWDPPVDIYVEPTAGGPGGAAITINGSAQLALSNATVIANGGQGGQGGQGMNGPDPYWAASGANGNGFASFPTIEGAVLSYSTNGTDYAEYASGNSTLYRYMKAVAAPADEITWEGTILSSLQSAKTYTDANGITVSGDGIYGTAYGLTFGQYFGPINFSASKGKFTKIEITCNNLTAGANISGFTHSGNTLTWSGESANVTIPKNNGRNYYTLAGVSSIKFTGVGLVGGPDKSALETAITSAEELYNSIKDNADYTTIASALKTAIDTAKGVAESDEADQDAIDAAATNINVATIIAKIDLLPSASKVTATDKTDIEALRTAYNSLDDTAKGNVTNIAKLETAEVALAIAQLPAGNAVTAADKDAIETARKAYDELTDAQKEALGTDALGKLETAESSLKDVTDTKEELNNAITDAEAYYESIKDKHPEVAATLLEAINKAKELMDNADANKSDVDAAIDALATAKTASEADVLTESKQELTNDIEASENYYATIEKKYPDEAAELLEAIITATMVKANADATQEQVNDAIKALAKVEKKTTLKVNVKEAEEYCESIKEKYPDIVPALTEGINSAKEVAANPDATTQQVEAALEKLATYKTTAENEVLAEAKAQLTADISTADDYAASIEEKYPEIAASFSEAVKGAKDVLDNVDATQQEVEDAIAIVAAAKSTAEGEVLTESKKELSNAITDADDYAASIEEKYPETAASLLEAISGTKDVADKADATQQEVDDAIAIVAAAKATAEQQVLSDTKTELNNDINKAMRYYISIKNSNPNAAATLLDAIVAARAILEDGDATQQDADAALSDIVKALQDAEQATGISLVEAEAYAKKMQNAKVIIGGKLYIFNNGKMYDANGSAVGNE
ncbi:MAG: FIVAR domain-containing protein [Prevotella sp.]|nr:FIVAR domain-containing protein [Prevotella sp.]